MNLKLIMAMVADEKTQAVLDVLVEDVEVAGGGINLRV